MHVKVQNPAHLSPRKLPDIVQIRKGAPAAPPALPVIPRGHAPRELACFNVFPSAASRFVRQASARSARFPQRADVRPHGARQFIVRPPFPEVAHRLFHGHFVQRVTQHLWVKELSLVTLSEQHLGLLGQVAVCVRSDSSRSSVSLS